MAGPDIVVMGSFVADLMGRGASLPVPGQTVKGSFFRIGPGGKGSNQAVAAARAGGRVAMVTRLGMDAFGQMALDTFAAEGIDTRFVLRSGTDPTGAALILVEEGGGQNAIMVIPGACGAIPEADVLEAMREVAGAKVLLLQFETNFEAFAAALRAGREAGMCVVCNPAPAAPLPDWCFPLIDVLTPNETEAAALCGIQIDSLEDAQRAARLLLERGVGSVVITLGEKGALLSSIESGNCHIPGDVHVPRHVYVPAFQVDALDTTGAGDAFNGALAMALAEGRSLPEAVRFANASAAISVTRLGTAPAMAHRTEIEALLASPQA